MKKSLIAILSVLITYSAIATTLPQDQSSKLQDVLASEFDLFGGWDSRCTTSWSADNVVCKSKYGQVYCTISGQNHRFGEKNIVTDSGNATMKMFLELANQEDAKSIEVSNIICESEHSGFANCGSGEDSTTCTIGNITVTK